MAHDSFAPHNHSHCIDTALAAVTNQCAARGLRLTPVRRRVLEILLQEHRAMGAYDILAVLKREGLGSQPPIVYRALDFLVSERFAHRIERMNAFVACSAPDENHMPTFLICRSCDGVSEAHKTVEDNAFTQPAADQGFLVERVIVEVEGLCPACQKLPS
ncbi:MAG: Fur family transcriptional regulator [Pseudomonadota bacterium]